MTYQTDTESGVTAPPEDMAPTPVAAGAGAGHRSGEDDGGKDAPYRDESKAEKHGSYAADDPDRPRWDVQTILEAEYDYCAANGDYCFTVCRGRHPDGVKGFKIGRRNMIPFKDRFEPEDKVDWLPGMEGCPHMLYRLPQLAAAKAGDTIFITEGEKDADTLIKLGLIATTNSSGAGKWRDDFSQHLAGRDVGILPDNDDVGRDHAAKVLRSVHGVASSVKVIELAGLPDKGDVSDWIEAGHTASELLDLVEQAQSVADPAKWLSSNGQFVTGFGGKPVASPGNVYVALQKLGVVVSYDEFAHRYLVEGLAGFPPMLDDAALIRLRLDTEKRFGIAYAKDRWFDIVTDHARDNALHPVRDYLDGLEWDGVPRLGRWLIEYGGAEDSEYVRIVGALPLIAAVRRIHHPGAKFDQMLVLEGEQGTAKSSALAILAVQEDWFIDDLPLDADTKVVMERTAGRWIVEGAELKGMRQGETEKIKATLSRRFDKARMAYARMATEQPRQCVFFGTTNSDNYLRDATGNRRFWPVRIDRFDLAALRRDRDQIWAEAAARERDGASIELPHHLWAVAAGHQEQRLDIDPFEEILFGPLLEVEGKVRAEVIWEMVGMADRAKRSQPHNNRLGAVMKKHGWTRQQLRFGGPKEYAYVKGSGLDEVPREKLFPTDRETM
jgi:hypothetical protein